MYVYITYNFRKHIFFAAVVAYDGYFCWLSLVSWSSCSTFSLFLLLARFENRIGCSNTIGMLISCVCLLPFKRVRFLAASGLLFGFLIKSLPTLFFSCSFLEQSWKSLLTLLSDSSCSSWPTNINERTMRTGVVEWWSGQVRCITLCA